MEEIGLALLRHNLVAGIGEGLTATAMRRGLKSIKHAGARVM
ncbi:hypothetical protein BH09PSE5_BH09PSE5_44540 [soil metagenome]